MQTWIGPEGSRRLRLPGLADNISTTDIAAGADIDFVGACKLALKVAMLSNLHTGRLNLQGTSLVLISVRG